jgi:probable HAF family extracellular repeat protein
MNRFLVNVLSLTLLALPASSEGGILYHIQAVPTLPGGTQNFALDINNRGQVTGNSRKSGGTTLHPYVWRIGDATPTEIGLLPGVPTFGRGFAVNDLGVVVGESGNGPSKPFRYQNGVLTDLGSLPGGSGGFAADINNAGRIVGSASNGQSVRAFYTDGDGVLHDLGTPLGTTNSFARAWAVNQAGVIAGVARNASNTASEATLWTIDEYGNPTAMTIGSPRPGAFSEFVGLNDAGMAVGNYTNESNRTRAFAYDGTTVFDLGLLPNEPTFVHARAQDVNNNGLIVGYVARLDTAPSLGGAAVLWKQGRIYDLNTLIDPTSGWRLFSAEGINDRGQIVGFGSFNGQTRAFVMTAVPEPSSVVLLATGVLGFWACRRLRAVRA